MDENKTELFHYLSQQVIAMPKEADKEIYVTCDENVLCSSIQGHLSNLAPCSHEEADTRLFLHVSDAVQKGSKAVMIRTVDTDVVVLGITLFSKINAEEMYIAFGTGAHFRYISIHEVVAQLDPSICAVLPAFHSFTGCDTTSSFLGRGKKLHGILGKFSLR